MLRERLVVAIILIPAGIGFIAAGGWYFTLFITAILCVAAWEFGQIFQSGGHKPATFLLIAGVGAGVVGDGVGVGVSPAMGMRAETGP